MTDVNRAAVELIVLYDPLCGWCYGASPALRRLADRPRCSFGLLPTGLFAGPGARPLDEAFAAMAWANDQRIHALTGVPFTAAYRERVLANRRARLDSGPAIRALTAVVETAPEHELRALEAIQAARYRDGQDVTDPGVLAALLQRLDLAPAADLVQRADPALDRVVAARITAARELLQSMGVHGVPTLLLATPAGTRVVPSELLYGPPNSLLARLPLA